MEKRFIETNGIHLHTIIDGDPQGEPIIFLHGFPDFWYSWRKQIPFFVEKGYRVIVPDQRGYNLSDKPSDVKDYRISTLAKDIAGLIDSFGYEKVHLVGHDWGAAVAWWVAKIYPEKLKTLNILNVPYPSIMLREMKNGNLMQLLKSSYMFFFQLPLLPEKLIGLNGYKGMADVVKRNANPGSFTDEDMEKYREAWAQPNAMSAMLNWYRALLSTNPNKTYDEGDTSQKQGKIQVPTLILWGEKDLFLTTKTARESLTVVENGELVFFPKSTHWIQHDEPDDVNKHLLEFIQQQETSAVEA